MVRLAPTTTLGLVALCGCLLLSPGGFCAASQPASGGFATTPQTLRVDYRHGGDASKESFEWDAFSLEGDWPGNLAHATDFPDFGMYKVEVRDTATKTLLFAQGFCTLFGEWRTTDEAKIKTAVYYETLRVPQPASEATLQIFARTREGTWALSWTLTLPPAPKVVRTPQPPAGVKIVTVTGEGLPPSKTLDIVIIADGYTPAHAEKALRDIQRFATTLLATPPFNRFADRIAIRGLIPPAQQTGPDEPRKQRLTGSPAGLSFNTFDSERYLTTSANQQLRDLASLVPYDFILVLSNTGRYGGGGIYNFFSIGISDNDYDEYVWVHEFGHAFAGLGDEYYTSSVSLSDLYPPGVEPWEPNVTALLGGKQGLKWKAQVQDATPIPTPDDPAYDTFVGAFEGAGYAAKGLYRPARDCKMFSKKDKDFCPVCMRTIEDTIRLYVE